MRITPIWQPSIWQPSASSPTSYNRREGPDGTPRNTTHTSQAAATRPLPRDARRVLAPAPRGVAGGRDRCVRRADPGGGRRHDPWHTPHRAGGGARLDIAAAHLACGALGRLSRVAAADP